MYHVYVVLTITHGYNAVRGHRTGSNNSVVEDYLRRKTTKTEDKTGANGQGILKVCFFAAQ